MGRDPLDEGTDWDEVAELVTDSYCHLAPKRLAAQVIRPGAESEGAPDLA